jgi:drug/metabolite transporter (DMT)-like permease
LLRSQSAFICSLDVVVVPFLDRLIGIPLAAAQLMAAGLSVVGVGFLSLDGGSVGFSLGDLWSFIQPVAFGIGFWRTEHAIEKYPDEVNRLTAAQLLFCFIFSLVYTVISYAVGDDVAPTAEQFAEWLSNPEIMFALLWTGVVCTALTLYLETLAMKSISAAETTLLISSEPLWAALFAWMLVGENLGVNGAVGGLFIVGACVVSMW